MSQHKDDNPHVAAVSLTRPGALIGDPILGPLMRWEDHRRKLQQYRIAYWFFFIGIFIYAAISQSTIHKYQKALDARDRAITVCREGK